FIAVTASRNGTGSTEVKAPLLPIALSPASGWYPHCIVAGAGQKRRSSPSLSIARLLLTPPRGLHRRQALPCRERESQHWTLDLSADTGRQARRFCGWARSAEMWVGLGHTALAGDGRKWRADLLMGFGGVGIWATHPRETCWPL